MPYNFNLFQNNNEKKKLLEKKKDLEAEEQIIEDQINLIRSHMEYTKRSKRYVSRENIFKTIEGLT